MTVLAVTRDWYLMVYKAGTVGCGVKYQLSNIDNSELALC